MSHLSANTHEETVMDLIDAISFASVENCPFEGDAGERRRMARERWLNRDHLSLWQSRLVHWRIKPRKRDARFRPR